MKEYEPEEIPTELLVQNSTGFTITNPEPGYYLVEAPWFPKVLKGIDVEDYEALQYMQRVLEKSGVFEALRQRGSRRAILSACMILSLSTFRKEQVWKC